MLRAASPNARALAGWRQGKVFGPAFFKKVVGFGAKPQGLSRLRQTQEGVRERSQWDLSQGKPSSGVSPWKCAKAHFQRESHLSRLKPAPSARCPLAEATAVFHSTVPPRPEPGRKHVKQAQPRVRPQSPTPGGLSTSGCLYSKSQHKRAKSWPPAIPGGPKNSPHFFK